MIKDDINLLKTSDMYSLSMFMLYKLIDDPEYTTISELPYILDQKNMLALCQFFGGQTIKIPTVNELYSIMHVLLIYMKVNLDGMTFEEAIKSIDYKNQDMRKIKHIYNNLSKVLDKYDFGSNKKNRNNNI